jgi:ABC-type multidrug transport system permease subunit
LPILEVEGAGNGHTIPRTFDDTPIFWIVLMLAFSGSVILYELTVLLQRRRKKKHGQPG